MSRKDREFRRLDPVHVDGRPQANGYILHIDWTDEEIIVCFPAIYTFEKTIETYTFEQMEGTWADKHGGTWMLQQEG